MNGALTHRAGSTGTFLSIRTSLFLSLDLASDVIDVLTVSFTNIDAKLKKGICLRLLRRFTCPRISRPWRLRNPRATSSWSSGIVVTYTVI
jgi:hypothetical protein